MNIVNPIEVARLRLPIPLSIAGELFVLIGESYSDPLVRQSGNFLIFEVSQDVAAKLSGVEPNDLPEIE